MIITEEVLKGKRKTDLKSKTKQNNTIIVQDRTKDRLQVINTMDSVT